MKKIAMLFLFLFVAVTAYAESYFPEADIQDLHIESIFPDDGWGVMGDRAGHVHEVQLGDTIGFEQAEIVEITKAAIIVDRGDYETRIPAIIAVGKSPKR